MISSIGHVHHVINLKIMTSSKMSSHEKIKGCDVTTYGMAYYCLGLESHHFCDSHILMIPRYIQ